MECNEYTENVHGDKAVWKRKRGQPMGSGRNKIARTEIGDVSDDDNKDEDVENVHGDEARTGIGEDVSDDDSDDEDAENVHGDEAVRKKKRGGPRGSGNKDVLMNDKINHQGCVECKDDFTWPEPGHSCYYAVNNVRPPVSTNEWQC